MNFSKGSFYSSSFNSSKETSSSNKEKDSINGIFFFSKITNFVLLFFLKKTKEERKIDLQILCHPSLGSFDITSKH